ncbi:DsrE family protein [Salinibacter sp. 10B]|uniref:DsrE family protein n=1 Tax=Salinibacter sp. 10B TaxID=1923971 RepID=UPI002157C530|nr:DsrE family protein [Salinibacter sp. 10B]
MRCFGGGDPRRRLAARPERGGAHRPNGNPRPAGVRVVACGLAMDKTGVTGSELIDGIDTAPNGFHELFRLQDQGYETLQL